MILEFQPRYRDLGRTLITRLEHDDAPPAAAAGPVDRFRADDSVFWGPSTPTS
jgi:hypothetical protein